MRIFCVLSAIILGIDLAAAKMSKTPEELEKSNPKTRAENKDPRRRTRPLRRNIGDKSKGATGAEDRQSTLTDEQRGTPLWPEEEEGEEGGKESDVQTDVVIQEQSPPIPQDLPQVQESRAKDLNQDSVEIKVLPAKDVLEIPPSSSIPRHKDLDAGADPQ